jgi:hypothetical protein
MKASHLKSAGVLQPLSIPMWKWDDISIVTSLSLLVCKKEEFQKLDLNLSGYEIINEVYLLPFPKFLDLIEFKQ